MQIYLIIAAISAVLSFGAGWTVQGWRFGEKEATRLEQEREAKIMREKAISSVAVALEKAKEKERVVYLTITETVERIVDRPVYSNICLDEDGVMAINRGTLK